MYVASEMDTIDGQSAKIEEAPLADESPVTDIPAVCSENIDERATEARKHRSSEIDNSVLRCFRGSFSSHGVSAAHAEL